MRKAVIVGICAAVILGACAPQSRVEELESRVAELEDLYNNLAEKYGTTGGRGPVTAQAIRIPSKQCAKPGLATWEEDGTLGCTGKNNLNHVDGWDLYFPASTGCIGSYIIMGSEGLTCDTPEHPFN